jgi:RNA polymerase sigma factor (sigma-70 family)
MEIHTSAHAHEVDGEPAPLSVSRLVQEHHGKFMRFLRNRMRGSRDPADVAQEAYIRMLRYEGSREIRAPYYMLLRVAMNVAQDIHRADRSRGADRHRPIDGLELASDMPTPESAATVAEELDLALRAIDDLPPRCRQVFLLHREQHLSYAQIAEKCGISVKMVEKHISTALAFCVERVWADD